MKTPSRLKDRSGKIKFAHLFWLIVLAALVYYGFAFGGVYWRQYRLEETVTRDLSFAGQLADDTIRRRVMGHISELNLPITAGGVRFARTQTPRALRVSIEYVETVNLLFTTKEFPMSYEFKRPF